MEGKTEVQGGQGACPGRAMSHSRTGPGVWICSFPGKAVIWDAARSRSQTQATCPALPPMTVYLWVSSSTSLSGSFLFVEITHGTSTWMVATMEMIYLKSVGACVKCAASCSKSVQVSALSVPPICALVKPVGSWAHCPALESGR